MQLAGLHILSEFALICNLVVFTVYWSVIHSEIIHKYEGWRKFNFYLVHITPLVGIVFTRMTTSIYVNPGHWKLFVPVSLIYAAINFMETKRSGKAVYWFLTWEDHNSVIIILALNVIFIVLWIGLSKLSHRKRVPAAAVQVEKKSD